MSDQMDTVPDTESGRGGPVCTIITPCYDGERYIERTIASVKAQSFTDWEYIIVDDGSPDATAAAAAATAAGDPRIRLVRRANGGVNRARNTGLAASAATTRYLLFLDQDDCLEADALATMVTYLDARPEVGMVYCDWICVDADDQPIPIPWETRRFKPSWHGRVPLSDAEPESSFITLWTCFRAMPSATLLRRSVFEQTPGLDESYRYVGDQHLMHHMSLRAPAHFLPIPLMRYRRHDTNMSNSPQTGAELGRLRREWLDGVMLSPAERRMVRRADLFSRYLHACRQLEFAWAHARAGEIVPTLRCLWRAARRIGGFALAAASLLAQKHDRHLVATERRISLA